MQKVEMPTFAVFWTDEQRADAQKGIDEMNRHILDRTFADYVKQKYPEPYTIDIDYNKLGKQLRSAGYTVDETEEIIARVECGQTVDSAMQTVEERR